ncbi:MAG: hypothetical protein LBT47_08750 [Deltaproteobacteria bacterium]|jgi:hypothetical protein|nr:hypothetical protein [Deltaproteobacteria bacterium]
MKKLSPDIIVEIIANSPNIPKDKQYNLLVSMAGNSAQTTAQSFLVLRPQNLHIITSEECQDEIILIKQEIAFGKGRDEIDPADESIITYSICDPTNPVDIYKTIKDKIYSIQTNDLAKLKIVIDITGGKKVMSAAAALAAWQLDMDIVYSEKSKYYNDARFPDGHDKIQIIKLDNPITIFGDQEISKIDELFNNGLFKAASNAYESLINRLDDKYSKKQIAKLKFKLLISNFYESWCDLNRVSLHKCTDQMIKHKKSITNNLNTSNLKKINSQIEFANNLKDKNVPKFINIINFFHLGLHYMKNRLDFSALLFYRCMEGILSSRIEQEHDPFKVGKPDYKLLLNKDIHCIETLKNNYIKASADLLKWDTAELPNKLAFMNSVILLVVLKDKFIEYCLPKNIESLSDFCKHLQNLGNTRNNSILAHGGNYVKSKDCESLKEQAKTMLKTYLSYYSLTKFGITYYSEDLESYLSDLSFINF